jgi:glycosyltransferase involved in cell wall biosynthesis
MAGVAGDAALLVPPGDVDELAGAIDTLLRGDPGVGERRRAGLTRVAGFTWANSAALHADAYRLAARSG